MPRRLADSLRLLCALVLASIVASSNSRGADKPAAPRGIIFVLFDDMGYGEPGCFRSDSEFATPNLNRLAREGMRFTDAHTAAAVCTPTRYGVLTGRYPSRIGQFGVLTTYSPPIIPPTRVTVASLLKEHGYHTACIGKWHLGMNWNGMPGNENRVPVGEVLRDGPLAIGFDRFAGFTHARNISTLIDQDRVEANITAVEMQPRLAGKAVAWLDEQAAGKEPFFLYLPLCTPHLPIVPAPEFKGKGGVTGKDEPYADWIYEGDWVLGRVLEALDRHDLAEETLIIASSDNGAAGRVYPPLRECKTSIYEGGHRVPYVARWPGHVAAGSTCEQTVCLNDLIATCADLVGAQLPPNAGEDSDSILPLLLGGTSPARESMIHQSPTGDLAIRQGEWKLICFNDGRRELYNLKEDLSETRDLAADKPEVVERLAARLRLDIENGRSTPGVKQANDFDLSLDEPRVGRKKAEKGKKAGKEE